MQTSPPARFITMHFSHFCEKARWAMQRRGFAYREEPHQSAFHRLATSRHSPTGSVPLLHVDGRWLTDSTDILLYVDEHGQVGQPLLPIEAAARADCLALEARMDEQLGPHTRRLLYYHVLRDRATTLRLMGGAGPAWEQAALPWIFPIVRGLMRHLMRIDSDGAQQSRQAIDTIFAEVAARLAGGQRYLVGDQFSAADLTFAALAAPVVWPPEYGGGAVELPALSSLPKELAATIGELQQTPAGQFALRIYRDQRQPPPAVPA